MFNKMYDIITFGSAAQDIHLKSKAFKILQDEKDFVTGAGICLPFGSKIDVEDIVFSSGGGGTNTAATFAKQGFKTAFCGAVGDDIMGREILRELKEMKIDTRFVSVKKEKHTNQSIIVSTTGDERTILVYRGASELLCKDDFPFGKLKARWFYLAPIAGLLSRPSESSSETRSEGGSDLFEDIIDYAHKNKIKIAANPAKQQLSLPAEKLKEIFLKVDILFLNQEEASFLTKIPFDNEVEIFRKVDEICPGIAVMTKGGEGVVASDGKYLYSAKPDPNRKVVDTTGAGDSLASGFLAEFIRTNGDIESAIQFGLANSAGNLSEIGAKTGLLDKNSKFERVSVTKEECGENNLCLPK